MLSRVPDHLSFSDAAGIMGRKDLKMVPFNSVSLFNSEGLCTTQVGGAQHRSAVHNVVLYSQGGAQQLPFHPRTSFVPCFPAFVP